MATISEFRGSAYFQTSGNFDYVTMVRAKAGEELSNAAKREPAAAHLLLSDDLVVANGGAEIRRAVRSPPKRLNACVAIGIEYRRIGDRLCRSRVID